MFGISRRIRSEQGSTFISKEYREFCGKYNIEIIYSPVGDHRGTGQIERLIKTIKERLGALKQEKGKEFDLKRELERITEECGKTP